MKLLVLKKINCLKILAFCFIFYFSNSYAEVVNSIKVKGNNRLSLETIKVYGEIEVGKNYKVSDLNRINKNLFQTKFFKNIEITLDQGVLLISVEEHPLINTVIIDGEKTKKIKEALLERLSLGSNRSFTENNLIKDKTLIKNIYASLGYNFVEVNHIIDELSENRVNIIFEINRGEKTKISKINFIGDKKLRDRRLRDLVASEEHKFWKFLSKNTSLNKANIDLDKRLLTNYYKSIGYYDVKIISSNAEINEKNETELTYSISSGNRFRISKISTNVQDVLNKDLFKPMEKNYKKVVGNYYSPFSVKKLLDSLDLLIDKNDLQFVEHSINEIINEGEIEVVINIFEGDKKLVEKINILGNTITNERVVRGELELDEGEPYNKLKLDKSVANLKSRQIFGSVKTEITEGSAKDLKVIDIEIEEKATGEIAAGAGVGTNGGQFSFSVSENNWSGEGIRISSFVEVSAESFRGSLSADVKNHNLSGNDLNFELFSTQNDKPDSGYENSLLGASIGTSFEQYEKVYLSPKISYKFDDLRVEGNASDQLKKQAGDFSDLSFSYGISTDQRDKSYLPTSGYIFSFNQELPIYADAAYIYDSIAFSKYKSFGTDLIGALKFRVAHITSLDDKDVRISKRLKVSSSKLRGFEPGKVGPKDGKDFVGGNYTTTLNLETSLPNLLPEATKTDVGLFFDLGNVWGVDYDSSIDDSNKIRSTAGVAANWLSPLGPMSFIFSQNISKASTDVTQGFTFNLGTTF